MKWKVILNNEDVNFTYTKLYEIFTNTYESSFPVRNLSRKNKRQHKPWMTPGLQNACKKKNVLYKRFSKARNNDAEVRYQKYKNKLTSILRYCEKQYYSKLLEESKNNTKETWKIIKNLLNKKSKKSYYPSEFKNNGSTISGNKKIAEYFNQFFVNIGPSLARTIPKCNIHFVSYLGDRVEESLFLNPVSEEQILAIVCKCKSKKSKGYDGIEMCLVKKIVPHILAPLRHICNLSLEQGVFPDDMEIAKVIPLFKAGDDQNLLNYRPISLLPQFSKILGNISNNIIMDFLNKKQVLYLHQYGLNMST